jgi:cephalosporin-C deacetylase-like acetyl esterase
MTKSIYYYVYIVQSLSVFTGRGIPGKQSPLHDHLTWKRRNLRGRGARHAEFLSQIGVGALVIDTSSSRGLSKKDKYIARLMEANFPDQLADAFGALNALQSHALVDGNKIGIMGYSLGGASVILAAYKNIAAACSRNSVRFALHIAFYAPCSVLAFLL